MSRIPAPPTLPKPKSLSKINDAATAEHDALLRRVWRNVDAIFATIFSKKRTDFDSSVQYEISSYLSEAANAAERARKLACDEDVPEACRREAAAFGDRLSSVTDQFVPPPTDELFEVRVDARALAAPLIERKTVAGNERETHVGFVDVECEVSIPSRIKLDPNLPLAFSSSSAYALWSAWEFGTGFSSDELAKGPEAPYWKMEHDRADVWIDVRITPLPLGQLMRELKTLRGYGDRETLVFVAMPFIDAETEMFLKAENFFPITAEWLTKLGFA